MKLYYYRAPQGNFGDDLNGWLWEELAPGRWSDEDDGELFCGIGTIIGNDMPQAKRIRVFSSGIGYRPVPADFDSGRWKVTALRGPLTAQVVGRPERAVADGALLLSTLPRLKPLAEEERHGTIFIPHYEAMDEGPWERACGLAGVELVDPRQCAHRVIERIRSARLVIADSMHAAIIADTMRVPGCPLRRPGGSTASNGWTGPCRWTCPMSRWRCPRSACGPIMRGRCSAASDRISACRGRTGIAPWRIIGG
ncbi:polysaccharide pyruvyl transferase family protein [Sphingobium fuliginis]|uniref:polysaccharide pyruvyl transferase family protein n=1 Tax=Sphingobium fuliginis (strain ATCC 27551) TaxID=336203 RepID=UPI0004044258|nr:polysaccharide pyruvyl transferase family protein [Sphingobium fuliginis]